MMKEDFVTEPRRESRPPEHKPRFYGRRKGPSLRAEQRERYEVALPRWTLDPASLAKGVAFSPSITKIYMEIGFGGGEHLVAQAQAHPDVGFIGVEPYVNGISLALREIEALGLENIRLYTDDVRLLLPILPQGSLSGVYILFPDPWPKTRHHPRRFVQDANLDALAPALVDGAFVKLATDHEEYAAQMQEVFAGRADFRLEAMHRTTDRPDACVWPVTRYEKKALAIARNCYYFSYVYRRCDGV